MMLIPCNSNFVGPDSRFEVGEGVVDEAHGGERADEDEHQQQQRRPRPQLPVWRSRRRFLPLSCVLRRG